MLHDGLNESEYIYVVIWSFIHTKRILDHFGMGAIEV